MWNLIGAIVVLGLIMGAVVLAPFIALAIVVAAILLAPFVLRR